MKKIICILGLVLVFTQALGVGCGKTDQTSETDQASEASSTSSGSDSSSMSSESVSNSTTSESVNNSTSSESVGSSTTAESVSSSTTAESVNSSTTSESVSNSTSSESVSSSTSSESVNNSTSSESVSSSMSSENIYEYPPEENTSVVFESKLGYTVTTNPTVFTLQESDDNDTFTYNTSEKLQAPVYMSVQKYENMDAQTLAERVALQSGKDDVTVQDANFGADGVAAKLVYYENDVNDIRQVQVFYAIQTGSDCLLVEMGSYVGVPETVDGYMENLTGTFKLN